jgi:hypothetical protein
VTTIVPKGANRGSANRRTQKAAQRTPLPPKGVRSGHGSETTAAVIREVAGVRRFDVPGAEHVELGAEPHPRALKLAALAREHGWRVQTEVAGKRSAVFAVRNSEVLRIAWVDGSFEQWASYQFGDGNAQRVQNARSAERLLERSEADMSAQEALRAAKIKRNSSVPVRRKSSAPTLPHFDLMTEVDLIELFHRGPRVTWRNQYREEFEQEQVLPNSKTLQIQVGNDGRRIVTFPAFAGNDDKGRPVPGQTRSVALEAIVSLDNFFLINNQELAEAIA